MIPIKLVLSGFLSYRDPVEVDFTRFNVAAISGANGAGKSSLLDGLTYALFGEARTRGDAIINLHPEVQAAEVALTFEYEGNVYRVQRLLPRDKTTQLEFQIRNSDGQWKPLTERSVRETDKRIRETLRLDYETFVNASFFLQDKADQFTQQRPTERKKILGNILGLEVWEEYRLAAAERRKRVESQMAELQGRLQEVANELGEEQQRKARLQELQDGLASMAGKRSAQEATVQQMRILAANVDTLVKAAASQQASLQRAQTQLTTLQQRLEQRQAEHAQNQALLARAKEIEKAFAKLEKLRVELRKWDEIAIRFNAQEKKRSAPLTKIEAERARLQTELSALQAEQARVQTASTQRAEYEKQLSTLTAQIKTLNVKVAKLPELETELKHEQAAQTKAASENKLLADQMQELKKRLDLIETATGAFCPTCGQALTEEHRTQASDSLKKEGKQMGDLWRKNRAELEAQEKKIEKKLASLTAAREADQEAREKTRLEDQARLTLADLMKLEAEWESKAARLAELERTLSEDSFAPDARAELAAVDAELKATGYDAAEHDRVRKEELEASLAETELRTLEAARGASKPVEREINELQTQISDQQQEVAKQQELADTAQSAVDAARQGLPDLQAAEREMLTLQEQENGMRMELGQAQQRVAVLDTLRQRQQELEASRETLAGQASQFDALERAFGKDGVPAMLIEQALPQIQAKANEVLERLSNGEMSLTFVTQQDYKDRRREDKRETLEIQIRDSAGLREYEMFSGGEAFRINFAIRLALSEVLAQRAGARLQTLVIDEGFASQDEMGRQRLVEVINLVKEDFAKILVITHVESLKDAFPSRIEVEKGPRGSQVRII
ncbi:MAG: SMC family ATPase [Anaerolineales bacterium]|nr:MAG: SMC family ATPase [Anaerolineales bacterium]